MGMAKERSFYKRKAQPFHAMGRSAPVIHRSRHRCLGSHDGAYESGSFPLFSGGFFERDGFGGPSGVPVSSADQRRSGSG